MFVWRRGSTFIVQQQRRRRRPRTQQSHQSAERFCSAQVGAIDVLNRPFHSMRHISCFILAKVRPLSKSDVCFSEFKFAQHVTYHVITERECAEIYQKNCKTPWRTNSTGDFELKGLFRSLNCKDFVAMHSAKRKSNTLSLVFATTLQTTAVHSVDNDCDAVGFGNISFFCCASVLVLIFCKSHQARRFTTTTMAMMTVTVMATITTITVQRRRRNNLNNGKIRVVSRAWLQIDACLVFSQLRFV